MSPSSPPSPDPGKRSSPDAAAEDRELLERLLQRLRPGSPALGSTETLLDRFGDLNGLLAAARHDPGSVPADDALVAGLALVQTVAERLARPRRLEAPCIGSWSALNDYVRVALSGLTLEHLRVLYLDRRNRLLRDEFTAEGTVDHAPVYPREVLRRALQLSASSLILVHNHPSGDPSPSQADIAMTRQVMDGARALGLQVHDHLIVGREGVASLRQLGLM